MGMKPEMVEKGVCKLTRDYRKKRNRKLDKRNSLCQEVESAQNEIVQFSSRLTNDRYHLSFTTQNMWLKKASSRFHDCFEYEVRDSTFLPFYSYQLAFEMYIDNEGDSGLQSYFALPTEMSCDSLLSLSIQTRDGYIILNREPQSLFNVHILTVTREDPSIIVMESMREDLWLGLQEIVSLSKMLNGFWCLDDRITLNAVSDNEASNTRLKYSCRLSTSINDGCKIISKAIESLRFIRDISLEDQIIVLKESFSLVTCILYPYLYDEESDCFIYSAFNKKFWLCVNSKTMHSYSRVEYVKPLQQTHKSFLDLFFGFLRKDLFVICILSVLLILEDKPGLSCAQRFKNERTIYYELLDRYINAKVISNEWPLDRDAIWFHIHKVLRGIPMGASIFTQFLKDFQKLSL